MATAVQVRKLPPEAALRLFPALGRSRPAEPGRVVARECPSSTSGRHAPLDLSTLRYRPTPPFCAWCGAALRPAGSA
jgi:hypothetical protein